MKAFISYSHKDSQMLERLHTHLAHLKREGYLSSWTDEEIPAGEHLDSAISKELQSSQLFIALLSPDYLGSNYCYETEFRIAMEMQQAGNLIIVPVIIEPCDWLNTPFKDYKALPQDGKAISLWENRNTAFLNVIQNLRKLLEGSPTMRESSGHRENIGLAGARNYRVKKDFDSIEKLEFKERSFKELTDLLKRFTDEINSLENIKTRILKDSPNEFQCMLVNRNKIATECQLNLSMDSQSSSRNGSFRNNPDFKYTLEPSNNGNHKGFGMAQDDYHLFWTQNDMFFKTQDKKFTVREMADVIWAEWLESVGIML